MLKLGTVLAVCLLGAAAGCGGELYVHGEDEAQLLEEHAPADVAPSVTIAPTAAPRFGLGLRPAPGGGSRVAALAQGDITAPTGDAYAVEDGRMDGDTLRLDVVYGGGCGAHDFGLKWDYTFRGGATKVARVALTHDKGDDNCRALVGEELAFDVKQLADTYRSMYGRQHGSLDIEVAGTPTVVRYDF